MAARFNSSDPSRWDKRLCLSGACLLIRRAALASAGFFDECYAFSTLRDDDFSFRLISSGWTLLYAKDVFVHYAGHPLDSFRAEDFGAQRDRFMAPGDSIRPIRPFNAPKWSHFSTRTPPIRPCGSSSSVVAAVPRFSRSRTGTATLRRTASNSTKGPSPSGDASPTFVQWTPHYPWTTPEGFFDYVTHRRRARAPG
jgi:cellulose synthase/poly-beta-1,6-N-acetylglucosamine synthase-like glycosyltransferase